MAVSGADPKVIVATVAAVGDVHWHVSGSFLFAARGIVRSCRTRSLDRSAAEEGSLPAGLSTS